MDKNDAAKTCTANWSGTGDIVWNGEDSEGMNLPGGVYFLKYTAGDYQEVKKVLLIR